MRMLESVMEPRLPKMRHCWCLALLALAGCASNDDATLAGAARTGDVAALVRLAAAGAPLDEPSGISGWTPLMHAVRSGQVAAARALLEAGADPNRVVSDSTALLMAAAEGNAEMVTVLLDAGADAAFRSADGFNVLAAALLASIPRGAAIGECRIEAVRVLRERVPTLELPEGFTASFPREVADATGCGEALRLATSPAT